MECAQINVSGGTGKGNPATVSLPGAYSVSRNSSIDNRSGSIWLFLGHGPRNIDKHISQSDNLYNPGSDTIYLLGLNIDGTMWAGFSLSSTISSPFIFPCEVLERVDSEILKGGLHRVGLKCSLLTQVRFCLAEDQVVEETLMASIQKWYDIRKRNISDNERFRFLL